MKYCHPEPVDLDKVLLRLIAPHTRRNPITTDALRNRLRFTPEIIGMVTQQDLGDSLRRLHASGRICEIHDALQPPREEEKR